MTNAKKKIVDWWISIDRTTFILVLCLGMIGIFANVTASPYVAERIDFSSSMYFAKQHIIYFFIGIGVIIFTSTLSLNNIKNYSLILLLIILLMMCYLLLFGDEIKGSKRWINLYFATLQPSEFIKPIYAIVGSWFLASYMRNVNIPGHWVSTILGVVIVGLLILQPDIGQAMIIIFIWFIQIVLSGLRLRNIVYFVLFVFFMLSIAYFSLDHVKVRVDSWLGVTTSYQISKSIAAFKSGGFFGSGIGLGYYKTIIPDIHSDFILASIAEEYGFIGVMLILYLYIRLILRNLVIATKHSDMFKVFTITCIISYIGIQAFIHLGAVIGILPTKGMTLPFISFGGSSMIALSFSIGVILSITKRNLSEEK